ncbi:hypothetical protein A6E01_08535 [Vibrio breoganii]|uniref:Uncharacterized protein n=1 Tax=Vibrio breoganii TaxID=553239 RepID=A0AAN0XV66_9VIBR|nr:hypothetical protein A6E01_08535 [Vibrio breoganii]
MVSPLTGEVLFVCSNKKYPKNAAATFPFGGKSKAEIERKVIAILRFVINRRVHMWFEPLVQ